MTNPYAAWRRRHRNPANLYLHVAGLPVCLVGAPALAALGQWPAALALLAAGYSMQLVGHLVEASRSGERILLRRLIDRFRSA